MKRYIQSLSIILLSSLLFTGCSSDFLDVEPTTALTNDQLWSSPTAATAFLDKVYNNEMPGVAYGTGQPGGCMPTVFNWWWGGWVSNTAYLNYGNGNGTDEAVPVGRLTDKFLMGQATNDWLENYDSPGISNSWAVKTYADIRTTNQILDNIDNATFDETSKNNIKGQALFWRAWCYNKLVKDVGGVPLILSAQGVESDLTKLQMPRSKTSECVAQILKDLDQAISILPEAWSGANAGRIDKGAAMAFKGRVLNFFASPLFNGLGGVASWQKAYDANLAAVNFLNSKGKGLYPDYNKIWSDEGNMEGVMVRKFNAPDATYPAPGFAPLRYSADDWGVDSPSLELVDAFPMKDGSKWNPATMSYETLFKNRDDRFYATVYYNGAPIQFTPKMVANKEYFWTYIDDIIGTEPTTGAVLASGNNNNVTPSWTYGEGIGVTTCFLRLKAVDRTASDVEHSGLDWPEIRYAEVLMNFGEAANEIGRTTDALDVLYKIRQRAGITNTDGKYGITASSQSEVRVAYQNERFVEFAFEGRRWDDLRRWKLFGKLRDQSRRHGLLVVRKSSVPKPAVSPMDDINTVWNRFDYIKTDGDRGNLVIPDQYYIYGLPYAFLQRNPSLKQNNDWGGDFNPLQ